MLTAKSNGDAVVAIDGGVMVSDGVDASRVVRMTARFDYKTIPATLRVQRLFIQRFYHPLDASYTVGYTRALMLTTTEDNNHVPSRERRHRVR